MIFPFPDPASMYHILLADAILNLAFFGNFTQKEDTITENSCSEFSQNDVHRCQKLHTWFILRLGYMADIMKPHTVDDMPQYLPEHSPFCQISS